MPPKAWTAWPLPLRDLPKEDLVAREKDEDEDFTYRQDVVRWPSSDLHDELSATVLRLAKDRFRKRAEYKSARDQGPSLESESDPKGSDKEDETPRDESRTTSMDRVSRSEDDGGTPRTPGGRRSRKRPRTYRPVLSADDDLSYELLSAPVRHILSQMDKTLQILHNLRTNGHTAEPLDSSTDDESDHGQQQRGASAERNPPSRLSPGAKSADEQQPRPPRKRGRPKKLREARDGESHDEFLARVAREGHRRLPTRSKADEAAFEEWLRVGDEMASREASEVNMTEEEEKTHGDDDDGEEEMGRASQTPSRSGHRTRNRVRLHDWSQVVGAAALAGFSPDVIARTTKRCTDLFGESMIIRRLQEVPISQGTGVQTTEYRPEPITFSSSSSSDEGAQGSDSDDRSGSSSSVVRLRRHLTSRHSASHSPASSRSGARSRSRSRTPGQLFAAGKKGSSSPAPRSRSTSRSSAGQHYCPVPTCERSANGFGRRQNLKRHLELVHGGLSEYAVVDQDSDDEVFGGVHVDGFLKTLAPARGWRGEDMMPRKQRGRQGPRKTKEAGAAKRGDSTDDERGS